LKSPDKLGHAHFSSGIAYRENVILDPYGIATLFTGIYSLIGEKITLKGL